MAFGGRSQMKMSEETFDLLCTACKEDNLTVEAVKFCVECGTYCCQPCIDAHKKIPMLRKHNLLDVSQGNQAGNQQPGNQASTQQPSLLEIPTERCRLHKGKVLDMYCEGHDAVGCSTCFVKDHKTCQDSHIHSIPDMIDTIFNLSDCKQTHNLLKDMVVAMETVSESKDAQLQAIKEAKTDALDNIDVFQKALEAVVRKISEASRKEVEAAYKERETELLQGKQTVDSIRNELKTTDDKLEHSGGNRAQRLVCAKLGKESLNDAENVKMNEELQDVGKLPITFIPDQSLIDYINAAQVIGQVRKNSNCKIKRSRDISIGLPCDSNECSSTGCCLTDSGLLVTDKFNKKLKLIDLQKMSVVDFCTLDSEPHGVCCISKTEVAVACMNTNKIQFVNVGNKMTLSRRIKTSHNCYGIALNDDKLYVTNWTYSLFVYDLAGNQLKTISTDKTGNRLFKSIKHLTFNASGNRMFVADGTNGLVCFDGMCNHVSTLSDEDLKCIVGVCVDGRGNVFVAGHSSNNVVQFSEDGKKLGVIVKQEEGLKQPCSICFHQGLNTLFVTMFNSNVVKAYEL